MASFSLFYPRAVKLFRAYARIFFSSLHFFFPCTLFYFLLSKQYGNFLIIFFEEKKCVSHKSHFAASQCFDTRILTTNMNHKIKLFFVMHTYTMQRVSRRIYSVLTRLERQGCRFQCRNRSTSYIYAAAYYMVDNLTGQ